jgi:hypothetical protein
MSGLLGGGGARDAERLIEAQAEWDMQRQVDRREGVPIRKRRPQASDPEFNGGVQPGDEFGAINTFAMDAEEHRLAAAALVKTDVAAAAAVGSMDVDAGAGADADVHSVATDVLSLDSTAAGGGGGGGGGGQGGCPPPAYAGRFVDSPLVAVPIVFFEEEIARRKEKGDGDGDAANGGMVDEFAIPDEPVGATRAPPAPAGADEGAGGPQEEHWRALVRAADTCEILEILAERESETIEDDILARQMAATTLFDEQLRANEQLSRMLARSEQEGCSRGRTRRRSRSRSRSPSPPPDYEALPTNDVHAHAVSDVGSSVGGAVSRWTGHSMEQGAHPSRFAPPPYGGGLPTASTPLLRRWEAGAGPPPPPPYSVWDAAVRRRSEQESFLERGPQAQYESLHSGSGSDGDGVLDNVLRTLDEFENPKTKGERLVRAPHQKDFHHAMVNAALVSIYGDGFATREREVLDRHGWRALEQELLVTTARGVGKTWCVAMFVAAMLICVPNVTIAVFAQVRARAPARTLARAFTHPPRRANATVMPSSSSCSSLSWRTRRAPTCCRRGVCRASA